MVLEYLTFNQGVGGSNPPGPTILLGDSMSNRVPVVIKFDITGFNKADRHRLDRIEIMLEKLGITFGTCLISTETREWYFDRSLSGPVSVELIEEKIK